MSVIGDRQALSTTHVARSQLIFYVSHDVDDGGWQFHPNETFVADDALIVFLATIVALDRSLEELADLPLGWITTRDPEKPWFRCKREGKDF